MTVACGLLPVLQPEQDDFYEITDYEKSRTIAIDIRSPAHKLVWRGSIARLEGQSPEAVGRSLDHDVAVLMEHFLPK